MFTKSSEAWWAGFLDGIQGRERAVPNFNSIYEQAFILGAFERLSAQRENEEMLKGAVGQDQTAPFPHDFENTPTTSKK